MKFILEIPDDSMKDMQEFAADCWELEDATPEEVIMNCFKMESVGRDDDHCDATEWIKIARIKETMAANPSNMTIVCGGCHKMKTLNYDLISFQVDIPFCPDCINDNPKLWKGIKPVRRP